jgi:hypothetical protein
MPLYTRPIHFHTGYQCPPIANHLSQRRKVVTNDGALSGFIRYRHATATQLGSDLSPLDHDGSTYVCRKPRQQITSPSPPNNIDEGGGKCGYPIRTVAQGSQVRPGQSLPTSRRHSPPSTDKFPRTPPAPQCDSRQWRRHQRAKNDSK